MADNVSEIVERPIYLGTELKFSLNIEAEGFDMLEDDFKVIINKMQKSVKIDKVEMILTIEHVQALRIKENLSRMVRTQRSLGKRL